MRLSRNSDIYKRIEALEIYEKRIAIETELHCRGAVNEFCRMYDTQINHYGWKPPALDEAKEIIDSLNDDKLKYFRSVLLLGDYYKINRNGGIFTIEKEIFGNFGHIPYNDDMGAKIDGLSGNECREYLSGIWWDSRKKAILRSNQKMGDYGGVNVTDYYIGFCTGMTKKEAQDFAAKAIEELYQNSEKYQSELGDIDFVYSICDLEDETITNTNWADMLFIYDYIKLYSNNGKIETKLINEIHEDLQCYYDYPEITKNDLYCHTYSQSHIRNWMAKIRKEINEFSAPIH